MLAAAAWAAATAAAASPTVATSAPVTSTAATPAVADYAAVTPGRTLQFPRDYGSHPQFRTEWWYVTGWLTTQSGESLGFQVTFFRTRPPVDPANPSAFAPRQLLVAHCAISDPKRGRLWQDQRIRRAGLGLADAAEADTHVWIDRWSLVRGGGAGYRTDIDADGFALHLTLEDIQPVLLNGTAGISKKGPAAASASYYYSLPHLKVTGTVQRTEKSSAVHGEAWFDHEWSSDYLDAQAVGWDWIGINLDDGGALMAFDIRGADGKPRWAGGTRRSKDGHVQPLDADEVHFDARRSWVSPRTGITYPVQWHVRAGAEEFDLTPLLDDQENDTRLSTGAIYWEGAVRASTAGAALGRGYLELTGYGARLKLR